MTLDFDEEAIEFIRCKGGFLSTVETYLHQNSYSAPKSQAGYEVF
jgi:hypothetical protein